MMFIILGVVVILIVLFVSQKKQVVICNSTKKLRGKTVIVTDGSSGLGFEIAKDLAQRDAKVIIACQYEIDGYTALARIAKATGNHNVYYRQLNIASLRSVRDFVKLIQEKETRLDILVNSSGIRVPEDVLTDDGLHYIMQVNYYGHFLLTLLLLPLLKNTATETEPTRIISITSNLRKYASLDVNSYNKIGFWTKSRIYLNSKLSLVLFSQELSKRLAETNVVVNCADPGIVETDIYYSINKYIAYILNFFIYAFFTTPWQGAQTAIHMAVEDNTGLVSGKVFENCEISDSKMNGDLEFTAEKLWEQSVKLVKLEAHEIPTIKN
ncbi:retinol dehydrogenase 14-like [Bicyclus anynana]|uniref:Retinol dehydrogenase 14-like n=1 Tax=Bicyclus anynana TaxID=110368 RepID=A0A6J1MQH0_BICAN|nr:retinol dehydrogenase 14-like [Bicyclus anynana]